MLNHEYLPRERLESLGFAALGTDVRIHPSCVLVGCERISIGSHVRIDPFCVITISGRLAIGDHVHLSAHAALIGAGSIEIGDHANVSHGAKLLSSSDDFSAAGIAGPLVPAAYRRVRNGTVRVGRHGIVGAGSILLPGAEVGEGASVGAVSLVKAALPAWTVNAGTPARVVGQRDRAGVLALEARFRAGRPEG